MTTPASKADGPVSVNPDERLHDVVVVGGGAGGLELVTRLGDRLGRRGRARITLIEKTRAHFWKPHLHELAAGSMDLSSYETDYLAQSHWHGFRYRIGEMAALDRARRLVHVAPFVDEDGDQVTPARVIGYDTLVIAVGSLTHDFGVPGVTHHAFRLDTPSEAARFHRRLINAFIRAHAQTTPLRPGQLHVVLIGAGATGVELAAELHRSARTLVSYGLDRIDPDKDIRLILLEAAPRILPALPERLAKAATQLLERLGVHIRTSSRVQEILPDGVRLLSGETIQAELVVWAAGVKAPEFLRGLDGLEVNAINQLAVTPRLQTTRDLNVFAIGDCAACPWVGAAPGTLVPPRAQAAHQQASHMLHQVERILRGQALCPWRYRDFGSLVSLGNSAVGNLMGGLVGGNLWVEGYFARIMYVSLY
jgi:NADH dehydrogenase